MSEVSRLPVILCWHMHQPDYRDAIDGTFALPWTYLHAIKDYVDMAAHLESQPGARAVVNFAPVLVDQLADYAARTARALASGVAVGDALLDALATPVLPVALPARAALLTQCLRANETRVIQRFPAFRRLAELARPLLAAPETLIYLSDALLADLLVWYHLGWIGESVRRDDARVRRLQDKGIGFTPADRQELFALIAELLAGILPRYRLLAERGRIELAMSPYAHPIQPLLLDLHSAREAMPDAPLPEPALYPGGAARAQWHLEQGLAVFERHFGSRPRGCWPSEGALSDATLDLLAANGFHWTASGESVLRHSRAQPDAVIEDHGCLHRVYRFGGRAIDALFRDDGLSDLIGFTYSGWLATDAVANLLHHLENIASACPDCGNCAVLIALDGENAWEYYPDNAWEFLQQLYQGLASHPRLELGTCASFLASHRPQALALPRLVAGSWVYGTLSTWIGSTDKNHGWEMLIAAKEACDRVFASGRLAPEALAAASTQLAVCEGSDWFWWFGDYNPAQSVSDFEALFRRHLAALYDLLGEPRPPALASVFTRGSGDPALGGVMRPGGGA